MPVAATGTTCPHELTATGGGGAATDLTCAGCVGAGEIATGAVGAAEIAAGAVGTSEIATGGVGASDIAAGAVGSAHVAAKSIRLSNLNATVWMNYTLDLFGSIAANACSNFSGQGAAGVAAGSYVLPFGVRPAAGGANPGWVIEAEETPTGAANTFKVRVCNFTNAAADPPNLRFNVWTIAP
jgi:hypothetical protein